MDAFVGVAIPVGALPSLRQLQSLLAFRKRSDFEKRSMIVVELGVRARQGRARLVTARIVALEVPRR